MNPSLLNVTSLLMSMGIMREIRGQLKLPSQIIQCAPQSWSNRIEVYGEVLTFPQSTINISGSFTLIQMVQMTFQGKHISLIKLKFNKRKRQLKFGC